MKNNVLEAYDEMYAELDNLLRIAYTMPPPKLGEWDWPYLAKRILEVLAEADAIRREIR